MKFKYANKAYGAVPVVDAGEPVVVEVDRAAFAASCRARRRLCNYEAHFIVERGRLSTSHLSHQAGPAQAGRVRDIAQAAVEAAAGRLRIAWIRRPGRTPTMRLGWATPDGRPAVVRLV